MSWSARHEEETAEFFDDTSTMQEKVKQIACALKKSKHAIVFTGAGISTSAGIPDFRSGLNTKLATGPGLWAAQADYERRNPVRTEATKKDPTRPTVDLDGMLKKQPSFTHRAIAALVREGYVKMVITQNVDNLHRKSGVKSANLVELHGNLQCERCESCGLDHVRDFRVGPNPNYHYTGRDCDACGGALKDYLVPFGEDLPKRETDIAWRESETADFCLAIGSSMTVTPACDYAGWVAASVKRRLGGWPIFGSLAIINIQRTPYDSDASTVVHTYCDDAMRKLVNQLGVEV